MLWKYLKKAHRCRFGRPSTVTYDEVEELVNSVSGIRSISIVESLSKIDIICGKKHFKNDI
jgi:hypothetical protein